MRFRFRLFILGSACLIVFHILNGQISPLSISDIVVGSSDHLRAHLSFWLSRVLATHLCSLLLLPCIWPMQQLPKQHTVIYIIVNVLTDHFINEKTFDNVKVKESSCILWELNSTTTLIWINIMNYINIYD